LLLNNSQNVVTNQRISVWFDRKSRQHPGLGLSPPNTTDFATNLRLTDSHQSTTLNLNRSRHLRYPSQPATIPYDSGAV